MMASGQARRARLVSTVPWMGVLVLVGLATGASAVTIGEAGTQVSMNDNVWYSETLSESYGSTPHVFATT